MSNKDAFVRWFRQATGNEPYPFQIRFADGDWLRNAVPVPGHSEAPRLCKAGLGEVEGAGEGLLVDVPTCLRATHRQAGIEKTAMAPSLNVGLLSVGVEEEGVGHVP